MVRNATKLYYPVKESIESALDLVDEFVIAVGKGDADDTTLKEIESIKSDKLRIIHTEWDLEKYPRGMENAHQTDIAKNECKGDWLLYLQADELIHEKDHSLIRKACESFKNDRRVEGFLFKYNHFWGDYHHVHRAHGWYPKETRIIRNDAEIHSWESAQSFRRIPNFDGVNYRVQEGTHKLKVVELDAYIYHYGWVRPPKLMQNKKFALDTVHHGVGGATKMNQQNDAQFDYGPLNKVHLFNGTHPKAMQKRIREFFWKEDLRLEGDFPKNRKPFKHERLKYRLISWIENNVMGGNHLGGFKNYKKIGSFKER